MCYISLYCIFLFEEQNNIYNFIIFVIVSKNSYIKCSLTTQLLKITLHKSRPFDAFIADNRDIRTKNIFVGEDFRKKRRNA